MSVVVFDEVMVEGDVFCTMISPTTLKDAIDIARNCGCNVVIKHFYAWKMMKTTSEISIHQVLT